MTKYVGIVVGGDISSLLLTNDESELNSLIHKKENPFTFPLPLGDPGHFSGVQRELSQSEWWDHLEEFYSYLNGNTSKMVPIPTLLSFIEDTHKHSDYEVIWIFNRDCCSFVSDAPEIDSSIKTLLMKGSIVFRKKDGSPIGEYEYLALCNTLRAGNYSFNPLVEEKQEKHILGRCESENVLLVYYVK